MDCIAHQASLLYHLPEFAQTHVHESVVPSNHLILCCPLLSLPFASIKVFSSELAFISGDLSIGTSASASILPMNTQGLFPFRIDWFDLLAVQGTLKSLLQHHNSKASVLWCSAFFMVQLSHPYMTTGKTIALTKETLVSKMMSLLLNTMSRLFIAFLPRSKHLLISWPQLPSAVSPLILHVEAPTHHVIVFGAGVFGR